MEKEDQENNINEVDTTHYIDAINSTFQPAQDSNETTHWFSTEEVYKAIREIDPGTQVSKDKIHNALLDAGYTYQPRPGSFGLDFRWMLKAK